MNCLIEKRPPSQAKNSYLSHSNSIIYGSHLMNSPIFYLPVHGMRSSPCLRPQDRVYILYTLTPGYTSLKQTLVCVSIQ